MSKKKTETTCKPAPHSDIHRVDITAAVQNYAQTVSFVYLASTIIEYPDIAVESTGAHDWYKLRFKRYITELYDTPEANSKLKVWLLKAEVLKTPCGRA